MTKYKLVPSQLARTLASQNHQTPEEYVKSCPNIVGHLDKRKLTTSFEPLQDLQLTRSNRSSVVISPLNSEVKGYQKFKLTEMDNTKPISSSIVYIEFSPEKELLGIDFDLLQIDQTYLDTVADILLSKNRLGQKFAEALRHRSLAGAYIGSVHRTLDGQYKLLEHTHEDILSAIYQSIAKAQKKRNRPPKDELDNSSLEQ